MVSPRSTRHTFVALSGFALAVFFLITAWSAVESRGPQARVQELIGAMDAELIERPVTEAQGAYQVEAQGQDGKTFAFPFSKVLERPDTVFFVNFWASWCKPCVRELPSMLELRRTMGGRNFQMIAVSYDEDWPTMISFFRRLFGGTPREIKVVRDPRAGQSDEKTLRYAFGTTKIPDTYVVRNGQVLARFVNERDWMDPSIVEYFKRLTEVE